MVMLTFYFKERAMIAYPHVQKMIFNFRKASLSTCAAFQRSESGASAMTFSLAVIPLLVTVGAGVDLNRAASVRTQLTQAVDAVTLDTAKQAAAGMATANLHDYANSALAARTRDLGVALASSSPSVDTTTGEICVAASVNMDTAIMSIAQINSITVSANACAQVAAASYEIALVLDTTGSMGNSDASGQSKLTSLKNAAANFIDSMYDSPTLGPRTKMSVVPFAPAVNVGTSYSTAPWMDTGAQSSFHWRSPMFVRDNSIAPNRFDLFNILSSQQSGWGWAGCVESLPYPLNVSDSAPTPANSDSYFVPMLAPDEPADVVETYYDSRGRLRSNTVAGYDNNYLGDKGSCSTAAPTDSSIASQTTSQSRLCKYKSATNKSTSGVGPNVYCPSKPLVRLQTTKSALKTTVSSLVASGTTNIHEGFMWGWRTISPNAPFADGRPYNTQGNLKVIVLMTDGMNTWNSMDNALNGSTYSAYGHYNSANDRLPPTNQNITTDSGARAAMDKLLRTSCANAREQGVVIYSIAFSVPRDPIDAQGIQLLKDCAGDESRYYAPNSQSSLTNAFASIGNSVGKLRLSR